jgi:hypothetical protein
LDCRWWSGKLFSSTRWHAQLIYSLVYQHCRLPRISSMGAVWTDEYFRSGSSSPNFSHQQNLWAVSRWPPRAYQGIKKCSWPGFLHFRYLEWPKPYPVPCNDLPLL